MWKLTARGARGTPFAEIGTYASIAEAAEAISKIEDDLNGWVFFRVPVLTWNEEPSSDAEVLSHLEYQSATRFYELTRSAQ
jgi:hypothetical protein